MTLGGLAISIGLLVDDAIIVVKNIYRRLRENRHRPDPAPPIQVVHSAIAAAAIGLLLWIVLRRGRNAKSKDRWRW